MMTKLSAWARRAVTVVRAFQYPVWKKPLWQTVGVLAALFAAVVITATGWHTLQPPRDFPTNQLIVIPTDVSGPVFAQTLYDARVISSPTMLLLAARITGSDITLKSGTYLFVEPISVLQVLSRVSRGVYGIAPIRITFTEGMSVRDYADTLQAQLPGFNREVFMQAASTSEGYLFPNTYDFMPRDDDAGIVTRLRAQFSLEIATITPQIIAFKKPFSDVVIMASLLEREAQPLEDKRMVAGILWNRLAIGMPLQVDAVFGYILQKNGYAPTFADLEIDSPYNTYRNKGLPPGPIANPGLESLLAAVTPIPSKYLYYLTGKDGKMYYGVTFDEHRRNRALYLDEPE